MASRYWVGGTASWNGTATGKWSTTSGGSSGAAEPTSADDVFFDANSGAVTVTVATSTRPCKTLTFTGFTGTFAGSTALQVYGNMTLGSGMTYTHSGDLYFEASGTLTSNGKSISSGMGHGQLIDGSFTLTLGDDLVSTHTAGILIANFASAVFDANNKNVKCTFFKMSNGTTTMGSGTWEVTSGTDGYDGAAYLSFYVSGGTLNYNTSTVKFTYTGTNPVGWRSDNGSRLYNIWFARGASTGTNRFQYQSTNTYNEIKDTGTAAHSIVFSSGLTYIVSAFTVSGSAGNLITINSNDTATHTLSKSSGTVSCDYLNIQHSVATGGAGWYAGTHSTNNQGVSSAGSGWNFSAPTTNYPITAAVGAFTLTGVAANLKLGIKILAAVGTFALIGISSILRFGRKITAAVGAFTLTYINVTTLFGKILTATTGAFVLTGIAANIRSTRKITADLGAFTLTGVNNIMMYGRRIVAAVGTYTLTLNTVIVTGTRKIVAAVGTFVLTGVNVSFPRASKIFANTGVFVLSGQDAILRRGKKMVAAVGTFVLTGVSVLFPRASKIFALTGTFTLTGYSARGLVNGLTNFWHASTKHISTWINKLKS